MDNEGRDIPDYSREMHTTTKKKKKKEAALNDQVLYQE